MGVAATMGDASAQWWPWGKEEPPPRPKKGQPPPDLPPFQPGAPTGPPFGSRSTTSSLCLQLEQRLVAEVQGSGHGREQLPQIETDIRDSRARHALRLREA